MENVVESKQKDCEQPQLGVVAQACSPGAGEEVLGDQEFKAILSYRMSSRPDWAS